MGVRGVCRSLLAAHFMCVRSLLESDSLGGERERGREGVMMTRERRERQGEATKLSSRLSKLRILFLISLPDPPSQNYGKFKKLMR